MLFVLLLSIGLILVGVVAVRQEKRKTPLYIPVGPRKIKVYIYNGLPIQRYACGDTFPVELIYTSTRMKSVYTGTEWEGKFGVKIGNLQFGFAEDSSVSLNYVEALSHYHKPVYVHARIVDTSHKWPVVELRIPDQSWFKRELEERSGNRT